MSKFFISFLFSCMFGKYINSLLKNNEVLKDVSEYLQVGLLATCLYLRSCICVFIKSIFIHVDIQSFTIYMIYFEIRFIYYVHYMWYKCTMVKEKEKEKEITREVILIQDWRKTSCSTDSLPEFAEFYYE